MPLTEVTISLHVDDPASFAYLRIGAMKMPWKPDEELTILINARTVDMLEAACKLYRERIRKDEAIKDVM